MQTRNGLAFLSMVLLVGCTSLLGNFEVDPNATPANPEGGACTSTCNGVCVDLQTDNLNCGQCGVDCNGGQTCQAGTCVCPTRQAFCNGQCSTANRQRCGPTCSPCAVDQLCGDACVVAVQPSITVARRVMGWRGPGPANEPLALSIASTNVPGTIYECRTGPKAQFSPTTPAWGPCDGGAGTDPVHRPVEPPGSPGGTFRSEHRYRSDDYVSPVASVEYYVLHAMDGVPACPRPGVATDGPHFTDAQYFAAAFQFSLISSGSFPTSLTFPPSSSPPVPTDPVYLDNPIIRIPFTNIKRSPGMRPFGGAVNAWPMDGGNYQFEDRSLRHAYVINPERTMILQRRQYARRSEYRETNGMVARLNGFAGTDCVQTIEFGSKSAASYGPTVAGRGDRHVECEAFVVNTRGDGVCLGPNQAGTAPEVKVFDRHTSPVAGTFRTGSVAATAGSTTLSSGGSFSAFAHQANAFIFLYQTDPRAGRWYRIQTFVNASSLTLTEAFAGATGVYNQNTASQVLGEERVTESGYAKLHGADPHQYNPTLGLFGIPRPSNGSKCYVPGCTTNAPWLTYLPP